MDSHNVLCLTWYFTFLGSQWLPWEYMNKSNKKKLYSFLLPLCSPDVQAHPGFQLPAWLPFLVYWLPSPLPVIWVPSGPDPGLTYRPTACGPQLVLHSPQCAGIEWGTQPYPWDLVSSTPVVHKVDQRKSPFLTVGSTWHSKEKLAPLRSYTFSLIIVSLK